MKSLLVTVVLLGFTVFVLAHPRSFQSRDILFSNGKHIDTTSHPSIEYEASGHSEAKKRFGESQKQQYLVHFAKPITSEERASVESKIGQSLGQYMPHHTYLLYTTPQVAERAASLSEVHWVGRFSSEYKFSRKFNEDLKNGMIVALPPNSNEAEKVAEEYKNGLKAAGLKFNQIKAISEDRIEVLLPDSRQNAVQVASWIAEQPSSHFLEPTAFFIPMTAEAAKIIESGNDFSNPRPFTANNIFGNDQIIGFADTGIRNDHCMVNDGTGVSVNVVNQTAYKIICYNTTFGDQQDANGHGTLVAGILAGLTATSGASNFTGIARGAKLYFSDISTSGSTLNIPNLSQLFNPARQAGAATYLLPFGSDASWYTSDAQTIDSYMRTFDDFLVIVPAGNNGPLGRLSSFAYSKNALVVGSSVSTLQGALQDLAAQDYGPVYLNPSLFQPDVLSLTSSRGPTADGRLKPDIVAPGQRVKSASNAGPCATASGNGTSLSAAVTAGAAALVRDYLSQGFYPDGQNTNDPFSPLSSSLIKAILINSGKSLNLADSNGRGNYINLNEIYPSGHQGFGRLTLSNGLLLGNYGGSTITTFQSASVQTRQSNRICFSAFNDLPYIKITLVWNDAASSPASGHILINDLDLVLVDITSGRTYKTNTADGGFDAFNNVEQISLVNPPNGIYSVYVYGRAIPTGTQQAYSLVISGPDVSVFEECSQFASVCPNSCSINGACSLGRCTCFSGREGVDCSIVPCPVNSGLTCSGNGVCDYATSTCVCGPQFTGRDCSTQRTSSGNDTQSLPVQIQYLSGDGKISVGMLAGVAIGAFILGTIISIVLGAFIAVKYLEYKRDRAQQDKEEME